LAVLSVFFTEKGLGPLGVKENFLEPLKSICPYSVPKMKIEVHFGIYL